MKKLFIIPIIILFISCVEEPKSTERNGNFKIEFLFEKDGCKMYRFQDGGRYIYWTNCEGKTQYNYATGGKSQHLRRTETLTTKNQ